MRPHRLQMLAIALVAVTALSGTPTSAALVQSFASGTGVSASLETLSGVVELDVGPVGVTSASGRPAFNQSGSVASVNGTGSVSVLGLIDVPVLSLSTGLLESTVMSDVDGGGGPRTTMSTVSVSDVNFGVLGVTPLAALTSLVTLNATVIQSTSTVGGEPGALTATGSTLITGTSGVLGNQASIVIAGVEILLDAAPAPNTSLVINSGVIPGLTGTIEVFLNEQIETGDGLSSLGLRTNALRVSFNDVGLNLGLTSQLLNGDLVIASSFATHSTPEPASLGMIAIFLAAAGGYSRYRRNGDTAVTKTGLVTA